MPIKSFGYLTNPSFLVGPTPKCSAFLLINNHEGFYFYLFDIMIPKTCITIKR